jgi:hypothetical protein
MTTIPSGAGPGAGSPYLRSSHRHARQASRPTTFCSSTAGTSASKTRDDLPIRNPGLRAARSATNAAVRAVRGSERAARATPASMRAKSSTSSSAPRSRGNASSSHSAPGPHAWPRISPPPATTRKVAGPSGVRDVRQIAPSAVRRQAGSPLPRR